MFWEGFAKQVIHRSHRVQPCDSSDVPSPQPLSRALNLDSACSRLRERGAQGKSIWFPSLAHNAS